MLIGKASILLITKLIDKNAIIRNDKKTIPKGKYRLKMLEALIATLKTKDILQSVVKDKEPPMKIEIKTNNQKQE